MLERIVEGRTNLVFDYVKKGHPPSSKTSDGGSLMQWCAYYSDVSAIKFLQEKGETLESLGADMGINAAAFHGQRTGQTGVPTAIDNLRIDTSY